ncbi:MAG: hypothetical protein EHM37_21765 [Deltaproteobacteria bacterium]|nr:MAG: hypothetical protein EHM37_21765 [Deltaproteobacteria bacterium]
MKVIVTAVALLALTLAAPAFSQMTDMPMMKGHGMGHGPMMDMGCMDRMGDMMGMCLQHAEMMGLTDDQLMKMKPIHSEMQKKQARFRADLKIAEIELTDIVEKQDFDLDKANTAVRKIEGIRTAHHLDMLKSMKEMRTLLTDEQFRKMKTMMFMKSDDKNDE